MRMAILLFLLAGITTYPGALYSQQIIVPQGAQCAECGMTIDPDSKFASQVVTTEDKKLFFCDIGDMLYHFRSAREKARVVSVKDYPSGKWIDGKKALYVWNKNLKTPMSWGISAFALESEAKQAGDSVDFNGAFKLLR